MVRPSAGALVRRLSRAVGRANSPSVSDTELLSRYVRLRDESAFELLVRRHQRMVQSVCRRVLRDTHESEDAFQATFLVFVRKAASLRSWSYSGGSCIDQRRVGMTLEAERPRSWKVVNRAKSVTSAKNAVARSRTSPDSDRPDCQVSYAIAKARRAD